VREAQREVEHARSPVGGAVADADDLELLDQPSVTPTTMLAISGASVRAASVLRLIVDARDRQHVAGLLERDAVGDDAAHRAVRPFTVATAGVHVIETEAGTVMGLVPILDISGHSEVRGLPDITAPRHRAWPWRASRSVIRPWLVETTPRRRRRGLGHLSDFL